jgi:adenosine deaminase
MPLFYRHLFRNKRSLAAYLAADALPSAKDLRQNLHLQERRDDVRRPEHFLNNAKVKLLPDTWATLGAIIAGIVDSLAKTYLQPGAGPPLAVPADKFEEWQDLLTDAPPLLLLARALLRKHGDLAIAPSQPTASELRSAFQHLDRQARAPLLPSIRDPRLEELIETRGLDDLHIHLNGSTEADLVWLDVLDKPSKFAEKFWDGKPDKKAHWQLQQEEPDLTCSDLLRRWQLAGVLRQELARYVLRGPRGNDPGATNSPTGGPAEPTLRDLTDVIRQNGSGVASFTRHYSNRHPLAAEWGGWIAEQPRAQQEILLLIQCLHVLPRAKHEWFAHGFYLYLLLWSQFRRLTVQQTDQYGFDQFQRITVNQLREYTETRYVDRVRDLQVSRSGGLDHLEGRFAPKDTYAKSMNLLRSMVSDFGTAHCPSVPIEFRGKLQTLLKAQQEPAAAPPMRIRLVGHFVKAEDKALRNKERPGLRVRHRELRNGLDEQWHVLRRQLQRYPELASIITGFDAAANELHAPPEVFAPLFRSIRAQEFWNFTFHAGEDFVHLLSGMRAVYEAMFFLELGAGNRIGHGTAIGVLPSQWREAIGPKVYMTRHDRLDDLVLARRWLLDLGRPNGLAHLEDDISDLAQAIYGERLAPGLLYAAWRLRDLDPRLDIQDNPSNRPLFRVDQQAEWDKAHKAQKEFSEAYKLFCRYHHDDVIFKGREIIEVDSVPDQGALGSDALVAIQRHLHDEVRRRGLAIEVLPTSNVRIGVYRRYRDHHLFRWLGLTGEPALPVVLGTDDPGIFATNLRNEYAHVLIELDRRGAVGGLQPIDVLERIVRDGKRFRFKGMDVSRPTE